MKLPEAKPIPRTERWLPGRILRCHEYTSSASNATSQCMRPADVVIRFEVMDRNLNFCLQHLKEYTYPNNSLCRCEESGEHVHYKFVKDVKGAKRRRMKAASARNRAINGA